MRGGTRLVQPARLHLRLLDPQVAREFGIVAAYLLDEALSLLASRRTTFAYSSWQSEATPAAAKR
jgi:hypothetical protein